MRQTAIGDMLLLNGYLTHSQYDEFYNNLDNNLLNENLTIIYSALFR